MLRRIKEWIYLRPPLIKGTTRHFNEDINEDILFNGYPIPMQKVHKILFAYSFVSEKIKLEFLSGGGGVSNIPPPLFSDGSAKEYNFFLRAPLKILSIAKWCRTFFSWPAQNITSIFLSLNKWYVKNVVGLSQLFTSMHWAKFHVS